MRSVFRLCLLLLPPLTIGECYDPNPTFPLPKYDKSQQVLKDAFKNIQRELDSIIAESSYNTTSYSIEVTSSQETLWSSFHTAREKDTSRPGAKEVTGRSAYRIASITKVFTVLGILQQHAKGNLYFDDSIDKYLTELQKPQTGSIPWKDITLRSLASQLSGLPRDWAQNDILNDNEDATRVGLPPPINTGHPNCGAFNHCRPCTASELISTIKGMAPLFAPNAKSTYSNIAFELLGLALAKVTNMSYEQYIAKHILEPIGMTNTTFTPPADSVAVLPKDEAWYWNVDQGVHRPTGGLYSTTRDLSLLHRYILTHYNGLHTRFNWLQPSSFSTGENSFYGIPWETFRTTSILPHLSRPITFYTKGGGLPGYITNIMLIPDYDLAVSIFTAGSPSPLDALREAVTIPLLRAADNLAIAQLQSRYAGTYTHHPNTELNSSLTLTTSATHGLTITHWISNGTDMFLAMKSAFPGALKPGFHAQLVPTLLFADEKRKRGELWRIMPISPKKNVSDQGVWDDFCITDVDTVRYDGRPLMEVVFWSGKDGRVEEAELNAFRVVLAKDDNKENEGDGRSLVMQQGEL